MAKRWKPEEIAYLKRYASKRRVAELAERFRTDAAAVQTKLHELGLEAIDSVAPKPIEASPLVDELQRAIRAVHEGKWRDAVTLLEKLLPRANHPEVATTARRYLAIARERLGPGGGGESEDPYLRAVFERNRGNLEAAHALCAAGGRRSRDPRFAYLAASLFALAERYDEAAKYLEVACELDPANRVHAQLDSDFEPMRREERYRHLF